MSQHRPLSRLAGQALRILKSGRLGKAHRIQCFVHPRASNSARSAHTSFVQSLQPTACSAKSRPTAKGFISPVMIDIPTAQRPATGTTGSSGSRSSFGPLNLCHLAGLLSALEFLVGDHRLQAFSASSLMVCCGEKLNWCWNYSDATVAP
jgi:hypothetical protein